MKIAILAAFIFCSNIILSQNRNISINQEDNILIYELKKEDDLIITFEMKIFKVDTQNVILKLFPVNSASDVFVYKIVTSDFPESELLKVKPLIHQQNIVPDQPMILDLTHIEKGIYRISYISI